MTCICEKGPETHSNLVHVMCLKYVMKLATCNDNILVEN
jgi:hypothetical protein